MSSKRGPARTIHPQALSDIGEPACLALLGIAADLRSGVIPPAEYDQRQMCGSACCIQGHLSLRIDKRTVDQVHLRYVRDHGHLQDLFCAGHPSDPALAADAIERYVFRWAAWPWSAAA